MFRRLRSRFISARALVMAAAWNVQYDSVPDNHLVAASFEKTPAVRAVSAAVFLGTNQV